MISCGVDRIGDAMIDVSVSNAVDGGFETWLGQSNDCEIDICCFSAKHPVLRSKSNDKLARNHDNVSK